MCNISSLKMTTCHKNSVLLIVNYHLHSFGENPVLAVWDIQTLVSTIPRAMWREKRRGRGMKVSPNKRANLRVPDGTSGCMSVDARESPTLYNTKSPLPGTSRQGWLRHYDPPPPTRLAYRYIRSPFIYMCYSLGQSSTVPFDFIFCFC